MTLPFKPFLLSLCFLSICSFAQSKKSKVLITNPGKTIELVGELGVKLGKLVTVEGLVVEGPYKGYENGPNLIVQKIGDSVIQNLIRIPLTPFWPNWEDFSKENKPNLKIGKSYRLRVYETGAYIGSSWEARNEANLLTLQTSSFYFRNELRVISGIKLKPIIDHPSDFIGRKGLFSGTAKNINDVAFIVNRNWRIELAKGFKWKLIDINKKVEIYGEIISTKSEDVFQVKEEKPRLVQLEDQLGRTVKLRGKAWSMNGHWWFNYRGTNLYVEDMENLPNWAVDNHGRAMEISGVLKKEKKPDIDQITLKSNPDLKPHFIIKNANWRPIDGLLVPEIIEELKRND